MTNNNSIYILGNIDKLEENIETQYIGCTFNTVNTNSNQQDGAQTDAKKNGYEECTEVNTTANKRGRKKVHLFMDNMGCKDIAKTAEMSEIFLSMLHQHQTKTTAVLETHEDNYPSSLFIDLYLKWLDEGLVERYVNGHACCRFLTEDCGIKCISTEKYYADWLKSRIDTLQ